MHTITGSTVHQDRQTTAMDNTNNEKEEDTPFCVCNVCFSTIGLLVVLVFLFVFLFFVVVVVAVFRLLHQSQFSVVARLH